MTPTLPESSGNRILFLDNIRYLMIVFVVLFHAAVSYGTFGQWAVGDAVANIKFFDITVAIIDVFAMPVLFFIAGYFALPNIQKKGTGVFLKEKFIRLGIPWLIGVIFIVPIITYIVHYKHLCGKPLLTYGQFWINWMKTASDFHTGFWYPMYPNIISFNQVAYWFISLLLFFFIIFGIIYTLKKRLFPSSSIQEKTHSGKTMLLVMLFVGFLSIILSGLNTVFPYPYPDPWVVIASVLQFQTWRLSTYIIYFALGLYAFSRNWFVRDNNFPGHPLLWISICIILCFGLLAILSNLISNQTNIGLIIPYMFLRSFLRATFLIVFMSIAFRYWNRPHKISKTLAANSYNIYLVHLPIVVVLQLLLINLTGTSSLIKFGIVASLSFLMSYAISRYAIKPHPRLSIAAVVVIFLLMVIFVYPRA
jgi:glucan biosynthesis protein C